MAERNTKSMKRKIIKRNISGSNPAKIDFGSIEDKNFSYSNDFGTK